ncbi:GTP-binding protein LepA [Spongiimicrobium salis]|uniref:GTP-binding protein LepA n=1 Tax=Spongiimicrobium salis TaxID=1667022 RepID=UPI00374D1741
MTTYIAEFRTTHKIIQIEQHSCFTWRQESGEIDMDMVKGKIIRESSIHFFKLLAGENYPVAADDIAVEIVQTEPFKG